MEDLQGVWIALSFNVVIQAFSYMAMIYWTDFKKLSDDIQSAVALEKDYGDEVALVLGTPVDEERPISKKASEETDSTGSYK